MIYKLLFVIYDFVVAGLLTSFAFLPVNACGYSLDAFGCDQKLLVSGIVDSHAKIGRDPNVICQSITVICVEIRNSHNTEQCLGGASECQKLVNMCVVNRYRYIGTKVGNVWVVFARVGGAFFWPGRFLLGAPESNLAALV